MSLEEALQKEPGTVIESKENLGNVEVDVYMWYMEDVRNIVVKTPSHVITGVPETITDGWFNSYSNRFDEVGLSTCADYLISGVHIYALRSNNDVLKGSECSSCEGTGEYECVSCGGSGSDGDGMTCWYCEGNGHSIFEGDVCPDCEGTGLKYFREVPYERLIS